jgi:hypothetical protein
VQVPALAALLCSCVLALAACGDSSDGTDPPAAGGTAAGADLRVTIRADGPGKLARVRTLRCRLVGDGAASPSCRRLGAITVGSLAPVPGDVACAELFGGPAVATVTGMLRGKDVDATFALSNSCEIARWRRNAALLGRPPGNPPGSG